MAYAIKEIQQSMDNLSNVFDIVRLVDPIKRQIITLDHNGEIRFAEHKCYHVWKKCDRCENCISFHAFNLRQRMTKFEFIDQDVYYVISKPVDLLQKNVVVSDYVLEIVSKITDEILFGTFGKNEFIESITMYEKKIYEDSLTKAFNRRYFDERVFCNNSNYEMSNDVVFIMMDLKKFKQINDTYGHSVGDWVLENTVKVVKSLIRPNDSIIRMGGDEFLIILNNCDIAVSKRVINTIKKKMKNYVVYNQTQNKYAIANFGVSCTSNFTNTKDCIEKMLKEADRNMFIDKNGK